jgi:hypothetical protein
MRGNTLEKIKRWLDGKNTQLDREHAFLKSSKSKFHRWLWRLCFKPQRKTFDIVANSAPFQPVASKKGNKIIHVVNLILPENLSNQNLAHRIRLTLESIEKAKTKNVTLLGCASENISRKGWKIHKLKRDAKTELGNKIDTAYLNDMLLEAKKIAKKGDIIFYSNLDCPIHPNTYDNLLNENEDITEFIRRDIRLGSSYPNSPLPSEDIFRQPFKNYPIGVDGLAIKKETLKDLFELFPDFVIGEPHWDTAISGILRQAHEVSQNTQDLYHILHEQQWDDDDLSKGGEHNKKLYRDAVDYGLMKDELISIKKDFALVLLKHSLSDENSKSIESNLRRLPSLQGKGELIFCEYLEGASEFRKNINHISYLPINPTNNNVKKLNQKNAILNLLRHYFSDNKYIIIVTEESNNFNPLKIKHIKEQLRHRNKIIRKDYIALKPKSLEDRPFDFFVENKPTQNNISSCSFINDDGLLELFKNHGHFQSNILPVKAAKQ